MQAALQQQPPEHCPLGLRLSLLEQEMTKTARRQSLHCAEISFHCYVSRVC